MLFLRQSTASQEILLGPFVDSTDGNTQETALTINNTDIKLWVEGATTEANKNSGGATHIANGRYYAVLDATDTATVGKLEVNVHVTGALAVRREYMVLEEAVFDAFFASGATGYIANAPVSVAQWSGTNVATPDTAGYPKVTLKTGTGTGELSITSGVASADAVQISGDSVAADNAESFFDGTGYAGTNNVIPTVSAVTGLTASTVTSSATAQLLFQKLGVEGTVDTGATTTSIPTSALSPAASATDQFKGRTLIFYDDTTTAALRGQATDITASTAGGTLTVTALSTAPASGDTFKIV